MREAFEKWVVKKSVKYKYHFTDFLLTKYENADYCTAWVDSVWMGWQACWEYRNDNH